MVDVEEWSESGKSHSIYSQRGCPRKMSNDCLYGLQGLEVESKMRWFSCIKVAHYGWIVRHFSCYHPDAVPDGPELKATLRDSFDLCLKFKLTVVVRMRGGGLFVPLVAGFAAAVVRRALSLPPFLQWCPSTSPTPSKGQVSCMGYRWVCYCYSQRLRRWALYFGGATPFNSRGVHRFERSCSRNSPSSWFVGAASEAFLAALCCSMNLRSECIS